MANYYRARVSAIADIDAMLSKDTPIEIIIYKISMKYGFSKKIVDERIKQLEDLQNLNAEIKEEAKDK